MDEREYLKILELLKEKDTRDMGKEMMQAFRKDCLPLGSILYAMLAYEVDRSDWNDGLQGVKGTFVKMDTYHNGCLHEVRLLQMCILQDKDSCDSLSNWLGKHGYANYETEEVKRRNLLLFFRRLFRLGYPVDDIEHWLFELENNEFYMLGVTLPQYGIIREEIIYDSFS